MYDSFDPSSREDINKIKERILELVKRRDRHDTYVIDIASELSPWYDEDIVVYEVWRLIDYGELQLRNTLTTRNP